MTIAIEGLEKTFGDTVVLAGITETFPDNQISVLLGASGCGKTTTLRCIAGLERPSGGRISLKDRIVYQGRPPVWVPTEQRNVSMVFQSYAIWPHMTVAENVGLPLRAARVPKREISERVAATLKTVGLDHLANQGATRISGGQQQRVALARAIVSQSPVILMDEPLSNLDAKLRIAMRSEIRALQRALGRTILFVTHDQEEALSIADQVYLFHAGRILQRAAPQQIYDEPETRYAAEFLGKTNILTEFALQRGADGLARIELPGGFAVDAAPGVAASGAKCVLSIRPEKWLIVGPADPGALAGRIKERSFLGDRAEYRIETAAGELAVIEIASLARRTGDAVGLKVAPNAARLVAS